MSADGVSRWAARWIPAIMLWGSALSFVLAWTRPASALAERLAPAMPLEAVVIHAGATLGVFLLFAPESRRALPLFWLLAVAAAGLYAAASFAIAGSDGALQFVVLSVVTYGGMLWAPRTQHVAVGVETALRWLLAMLSLTLVFGLVDAPASAAEWTDIPSRLLAGALHFGLLGTIEATGLYVALRRVGAEG